MEKPQNVHSLHGTFVIVNQPIAAFKLAGPIRTVIDTTHQPRLSAAIPERAGEDCGCPVVVNDQRIFVYWSSVELATDQPGNSLDIRGLGDQELIERLVEAARTSGFGSGGWAIGHYKEMTSRYQVEAIRRLTHNPLDGGE